MPVWVRNRLTFDGDKMEIDRLLQAVRYDVDENDYTQDYRGLGSIDFDKVIPLRCYFGASDVFHERKMLWGTERNSRHTRPYNGDYKVVFDTADGVPDGILESLSKQFPTLTILHEYATGFVNDCAGRLLYRGGEVVEREQMGKDSRQSTNKREVELICELWDGCSPHDWGYELDETGNYVMTGEVAQRACFMENTDGNEGSE